MWIYGTIFDSILDTVLKKNTSARDIWLAIENLFRDNKEARALQLENELRTTVIGDISVHEYCQKMKTTSDLLANIDFPVTDRVLGMHILNGLSDKFDYIINVIQHKSPFPGFLETQSMLQMEEERLSKQVKPSPSHHDTSSSSTILYTTSDNSSRSSGNNFHNSGRGNRGRNRGGGRRGRGRFNNTWPSHQVSSQWAYNPQHLAFNHHSMLISSHRFSLDMLTPLLVHRIRLTLAFLGHTQLDLPMKPTWRTCTLIQHTRYP